jgi:hypothetical protein
MLPMLSLVGQETICGKSHWGTCRVMRYHTNSGLNFGTLRRNPSSRPEARIDEGARDLSAVTIAHPAAARDLVPG